MRVFRIEREKFLKTTLSGIGASTSKGNRWNSLLTRLVYTAESRALAILEVAVHLDLSEDLPSDRHYVEIDIPDDIIIQEVLPEDLPAGWDSKPPIFMTQYIGDYFVQQGDSAVLRVPSCIVPQESNFLINPDHPDSKRITVIRADPMLFDQRFRLIK